MKSMAKITFQKIDGELPVFKHAHKNDAGYDLYSTENLWIRAGETETIQTNLRVCIPEGYVGLVTGNLRYSRKCGDYQKRPECSEPGRIKNHGG
jgi:dUTPase